MAVPEIVTVPAAVPAKRAESALALFQATLLVPLNQPPAPLAQVPGPPWAPDWARLASHVRVAAARVRAGRRVAARAAVARASFLPGWVWDIGVPPLTGVG